MNQQIREAESSLEKQDYKTAEAKLKVLAAYRSKDGRVQYDLGFAEERNGEEADAAKAYEAAIAAMPEFAEPKVALGLLDARAGRIAGGASAADGCGDDPDRGAGDAWAGVACAGAHG